MMECLPHKVFTPFYYGTRREDYGDDAQEAHFDRGGALGH